MTAEYTRIGARDVPVQLGERSRIYFTGDCEARDPSGFYDFWTAKNSERRLITARCPSGRDPGERFRMMEGQPGYEDSWHELQTAVLVRPATRQAIADWLNHPSKANDAPCAKYGEVAGKRVSVTHSNGYYLVREEEPDDDTPAAI